MKDDAGLHAEFNDIFLLEHIEHQIKEEAKIIMKTYDKDIATSDLLGCANPISLINMC